jgi:hypothetical protein
MQHNFFFRKFNENYRKQESEYRKMTHEEWQEGFSQIRKLIYRTQGQLYGVQRRRYPIWQIANCVCTAREQLQKVEQELNELDRTAEIGDAAMQQCNADFRLALTELETARKQLLRKLSG